MLRLNAWSNYATIEEKKVPGNPQRKEAGGVPFFILISNFSQQF